MALHIVQEHTEWDILDIDPLHNREEYMESRTPLYGQLEWYTTKSAPHASRTWDQLSFYQHMCSTHHRNGFKRRMDGYGACVRRHSGRNKNLP
eukprot:8243667-Karenia_brevis.AAC.1